MQLISNIKTDNNTETLNFFNENSGEGARCFAAWVGGSIFNCEIELFNVDLGLRKFVHTNNPEPSAEYVQSLCDKHFSGIN